MRAGLPRRDPSGANARFRHHDDRRTWASSGLPGGSVPRRHIVYFRILITEERIAPESAAPSTCFDELLGSGQDALGYFLMLRSTLRRKRPHAMNEVLSYGDFSLDQEKFVVSFAGRQAPINKLQFSVLGAMLDAPRMVRNKVFLNRGVFGPSQMRPGRQFDTYMSLVRRPLRKELGIDPVVAEQRRGYALSHDLLVERNSRRTSHA
jgi:DNA-binding winged helix-turn-helix (wHTH) protein